jgi:hypothetical protein
MAQWTIRIGSMGPSNVVRMPVGRKAIWAARTSVPFERGLGCEANCASVLAISD